MGGPPLEDRAVAAAAAVRAAAVAARARASARRPERALTPLPYKRAMNILVGEPIAVPAPKVKGEKPDAALVDEYHAKYVAALRALHAAHVPDRELQVL